MSIAAARRHLEELRKVFIDRYNSADPEDNSGLAVIDAAIKAGADADIEGLKEALAGYNLYAHHESLALAEIASAEAELSQDEPVAAEEAGKPLSQQNKAELLATAAVRGVDVPEGATVAQLRAALTPAGFEEPEDEPEPDFDEQPDADLVNTHADDQPSADVVNSARGGTTP